jgi:predicted ferric reductase
LHDSITALLLAELSYILEIILFLLLFASYYFASEKEFKIHRMIVRYMVLIQTLLVIFMALSFLFTSYGHAFVYHAIVGLLVYSLIIYTFLTMEKKIPKQLTIPKYYNSWLMRISSVLWGIAILSGIYSYITID